MAPFLSSNSNNNSHGDAEEGQSLLGNAPQKVKRAWDGFIDFVFSDNVLEVAVGLIIASQFTALITSFTSDIILPPVSLIPGIGKNFEERFSVLKTGTNASHADSYNTIKQARDDGAVVLAWGSFVDKLITFFVLGLTLYTLAQLYSWTSDDNIVKRTVKCKYCRKRISTKAKRCFNCTSWQDGREDQGST